MSDLISKEELYKRTVNKNSVWFSITNSEGKNLKEIVEEIPSANIIECAKSIKKYCTKNMKTPHFWCEGCPLYDSICRETSFSTIPALWDLPEGEKE